MSLSLSNSDSIEEVIQGFRKVLHSSLPLRHISQFYEDEKIREATELVKENILKTFTEANPNLITDLLKEGFQNVIDEFVKRNEDHKSQSESFFKKQVDLICETFMMSTKAKLEINPEMDLISVEEMLESGKMVAMKYFEENWNLGNVGLLLTKKEELEKKLDLLGKEMLENHRVQLESLEAEKVFEEVKAIILEMSRHVKCYVDTYEGKISKQVLQERAQNIYDYLEGKGYVLNEKYENIWSKLIGTAKAAVTVLNNGEENMSTDDCIRFAERLDTRLQILCSESETNLGGATPPSAIMDGQIEITPVNMDELDCHNSCKLLNDSYGQNASSFPSVSDSQPLPCSTARTDFPLDLRAERTPTMTHAELKKGDHSSISIEGLASKMIGFYMNVENSPEPGEPVIPSFHPKPNKSLENAVMVEPTPTVGDPGPCGTAAAVPLEKTVFTCPVCNKSFTKNVTFRRHKNIHTGKFSCERCSKSYGSNVELNRHLLAHSGERPFQCSFCKARYLRKFTCDKHMERVHNLSNPKLSKNIANKVTMEMKRQSPAKRPDKCSYLLVMKRVASYD